MKRKAVVLSLLLALCLCLCAAARADFSLNPLPDPMAIPEQFDLFSGEAPALPTVEVGEGGVITIKGLKAWDVVPELLMDWEWSEKAADGWKMVGTEQYEDQLVLRSVNPNLPGFGFALERAGNPSVFSVFITDFNYEGAPGELSVEIECPDGVVDLYAGGRMDLMMESASGNVTMQYENGELSQVAANQLPDGKRTSEVVWELIRATDCITGKKFDEISYIGEDFENADPDDMPFRIAGEQLESKFRQGKDLLDLVSFENDKDPYADFETLPTEELPREWPEFFPDRCPEYSCRLINGKFVYSVSNLTDWGARYNIRNETYGERQGINYFMRDYTLTTPLDNQIRVVSTEPDGSFRKWVETGKSDRAMALCGSAQLDPEGKEIVSAQLSVEIELSGNRTVNLCYYSDGSKSLTMEVAGGTQTGWYGEDNKLK